MNRIDAERQHDRLVLELDSALVGFDQGARQYRAGLMEQVSRLVGYNLTYATLLMLERMNEDATTRMTELASSVGVTCATITRQIQDLEKKGLVLRVQDNQDGRASIVRLTEEGSRVAELASEARRSRLGQAVADWSDGDLEQMIAFFRRLPVEIVQFGTTTTSIVAPDEQCAGATPGDDLQSSEQSPGHEIKPEVESVQATRGVGAHGAALCKAPLCRDQNADPIWD